MALSCYSNWGELEQPELSSELLSFNTIPNSAFSDPYIDPLLESHDFLYSENYTSLLPYFSAPFTDDDDNNNLYSLIPDVFQEVEYETYPNPKRQKSFEGCCNDAEFVVQGLCNGFVPTPSLFQELMTSEILSPFPTSFASNPPVFSSESSVETEKNAKKGSNGGGGTLSAQSIAARQRRRKITEKTQELGKLIPGGHKMNTAEMFQAAFKYIKFLQAQLGILQTLDSVQENGESFQNQALNLLLGSSLIQEKLYSTEKFLVPNKFVQSVGNPNWLQSNTRALKEFDENIGIGG